MGADTCQTPPRWRDGEASSGKATGRGDLVQQAGRLAGLPGGEPRHGTARSIWSAVNLKRIEELIALDLVRPAGLKAYRERDESRARLYAFEQESVAFDDDQAATFAANAAAWVFFQAQPPGYQRLATWWVISARRPDTRARRLAQLIDDSAAGRRLKQYARG